MFCRLVQAKIDGEVEVTETNIKLLSMGPDNKIVISSKGEDLVDKTQENIVLD